MKQLKFVYLVHYDKGYIYCGAKPATIMSSELFAEAEMNMQLTQHHHYANKVKDKRCSYTDTYIVVDNNPFTVTASWFDSWS